MNRRIVVVEDDAKIREFLETLLTDEGYTVQAFVDGRGVIESIAAQCPAAVLTDIMMPEKDGMTVLSEIRAHTTAVPVVMMSAWIDQQQQAGFEQELRRLGACAFIPKPLDIPALLTTLATAIAQSQCEETPA